MEALRRSGAVYGEEYRAVDGLRIAAVVKTDPALASHLADALKVSGDG